MGKKKSDESVLFSEVSVGKYKIKPFSFGMLFEVSSMLESVIDKAESKGLVNEFFNESGNISYISLIKLFTLATDEILDIMSKVLGVDKSEVQALSMDEGVRIAYVIYNQNKEVIKNAVSSLAVLIKAGEQEENQGQDS